MPARRLAALGGRRIGPHLSLSGGLLKAAERAREIGATTVQVFADNPTSWRRRLEPPVGIDRFRTRLAELDIGPLAIHASYLVNLCGSDEEFRRRSIETLIAEMRMAVHYGARFVNVHIGSHKGLGRDEGIARLAAGLVEVERAIGRSADLPLLVLENSAGMGDGVGSRLEDLVDILEAAAAAGLEPERIGYCLDTAHLWGAGYELDDPDGLDRLLMRFDAQLGPGYLTMLHLNDSRATRGSQRDRHEHIGAGLIGEQGMAGLLTHPRLAGVPTFLETPGMDLGYDRVNMDRVRRLIAGRELPRLPARAFAARSARPVRKRRNARGAVVAQPEMEEAISAPSD
ncbi:MAG: deoxyribonuclease IV [Chloroflexota bacterium]|nr:deoxyribonuclease IV [Chloroflexota bacterium]